MRYMVYLGFLVGRQSEATPSLCYLLDLLGRVGVQIFLIALRHFLYGKLPTIVTAVCRQAPRILWCNNTSHGPSIGSSLSMKRRRTTLP
jgi:3-deoxy-D-arabino-heptulosonate 7-phosphate (DAHP) synthase class II